MTIARFPYAALPFALAASLAGCGTPMEKTAPCKRPVNMMSYADNVRSDCGPMTAVNADPAAVLAAIGAASTSQSK